MASYKELITEYPKVKVEEFLKWKFANLKNFHYKSDNFEMSKKTRRQLETFCKTNKPIEQVVGYSMFLGREYYINKNVLIPRSETEILVDIFLGQVSKGRVLEIGVGSGCISSSIYLGNNNISIDASDISRKAIKVARKNFKRHGVNANLIESNLFDKVNISDYNYIISNPPYISLSDNIDASVLDNEPHIALFADDNGLFFYKEIILKSLESNKVEKCFFEIGSKQKEPLESFLKSHDISNYKFHKDYSGHFRVLAITLK